MSLEKPNLSSIVCESKSREENEIEKYSQRIKNEILSRIPTARISLHFDFEISPSDRIKIRDSKDSARTLRKLWNPNTLELQEHFGVLLLNNDNKVIGLYPQSSGGMTSTLVDVRLVMISALSCGALGIIACHNHPSGSVKPSISDRELTDKMRKAAETLDIRFLDHIILSTDKYFSFADNGEL